jgi:hypothetical protein
MIYPAMMQATGAIQLMALPLFLGCTEVVALLAVAVAVGLMSAMMMVFLVYKHVLR